MVERDKNHIELHCPKFEGLIKKYGAKVIEGLNSDTKQYFNDLGILLDRDKDVALFDHQHNCSNLLSRDGCYTNMAEAVLMATRSQLKMLNPRKYPFFDPLKILKDQNTTFIREIYANTAARSNKKQAMIILMKEMGVHVLESSVVIRLEHHFVDFGSPYKSSQTDHQTSDYDVQLQDDPLTHRANWSDLEWMYLEYVQTLSVGQKRSTKELNVKRSSKSVLMAPTSPYLSRIHRTIKQFLAGDVSEHLHELDQGASDGAMFFVSLSIKMKPETHANLIRFMKVGDNIEVYVFEPHGIIEQDAGTSGWYGTPQRFIRLLLTTLKAEHVLRSDIVMGNLTCPKLQDNLPLCAMYVMYFAVMHSVAEEFGVSSYLDIEQFCNVKHSTFESGSKLDRLRTQIIDVDDKLVQPEHACTHDIMIMMLIAFYGIGCSRLQERDIDFVIQDDSDTNSTSDNSTSNSNSVTSSYVPHPRQSTPFKFSIPSNAQRARARERQTRIQQFNNTRRLLPPKVSAIVKKVQMRQFTTIKSLVGEMRGMYQYKTTPSTRARSQSNLRVRIPIDV